MLRLAGGQVESLWDEVLPVEVRELPEDLAALDVLLSDPGCWRRSRALARRRGDRRAGVDGGGRRSRWRRMCG